MQSKIIFFGSEDYGAINYFKNLFNGTTIRAKQYTSLDNLIELVRTCSDHRVNAQVVVMTGSALGHSTVDKIAIDYCIGQNIICYSVIEHWTWYQQRFKSFDRWVLPNKIFVNDEVACNQAIAAGLPPGAIVALGNPILEALSRVSPTNKNTIGKAALKRQYGFSEETTMIVFVSEDLQTDFRRRGEDLLGFDEYEVFDVLQSVFAGSKQQIVVKRHPAEILNKYGPAGVRLRYLDKVPVLDLAIMGDVIVGMGSMLLLELAMYRDDVISLRPNAIDSFIGEQLGAVIAVRSRLDLIESLGKRAQGVECFRQRYLGSQRRILHYLGVTEA
jgi:hypothetical protein